MPPAISCAKTSIYRTANTIISQRTAVSKVPAGIQYRSQLECVPAAESKPWEAQSQPARPVSMFSVNSLPRRSKPPSAVQPSRASKGLPREAYACVLEQLEVLHFGKGSQSCTTCYLRDLYNLALTSRAWDKAARNKLYSSLWIPAPDPGEAQLPKSKAPGRLKLLRKALRERSALAKLVRHIKASELQQAFLQANYNEGQDIINDLASIVMACPNLERLVGFHWIYNHEYDRLNHALSTRPHLKERAWLIGNPVNQGLAPGKTRTQQEAFELYPGPTELFLHHHDNHPHLHTLFLHGAAQGIMDFRSFVATFRKLPRLAHLHLSNFAAPDFNDRTLAALPPTLTSLRLESLDGVTDRGLLRYFTSSASNLSSLSLIHQEIVDLLILIALLRRCPRLEALSIVQDGSPGVGPSVPLFRPVFASSSLRRLHWDILVPGPATTELAVSIAGGAFPALERLRAPCDREGVLQDLCRPRGWVLLPGDEEAWDGRGVASQQQQQHQHHRGASEQQQQQQQAYAHNTRNLAKARRAAQRRIDARACVVKPRAFSSSTSSSSRSLSSLAGSASGSSVASASGPGASGIQIVVEQEDGVVVERLSFEHVGTVGSRVEYWLEPDVEGSADAVIGVADLLLGRPARGVGGDGGGGGFQGFCKGDGMRGWHRPRGRVRAVEVGDFF